MVAATAPGAADGLHCCRRHISIEGDYRHQLLKSPLTCCCKSQNLCCSRSPGLCVRDFISSGDLLGGSGAENEGHRTHCSLLRVGACFQLAERCFCRLCPAATVCPERGNKCLRGNNSIPETLNQIVDDGVAPAFALELLLMMNPKSLSDRVGCEEVCSPTQFASTDEIPDGKDCRCAIETPCRWRCSCEVRERVQQNSEQSSAASKGPVEA